jgi:phosphatase NudJ
MNHSKLLFEIHHQAPEDFCPQVHVAACYLEIDRKILLLQCREGKSESGKWGVPAGKVEPNESALEAAQRELFEETGIAIRSPGEMSYVHTLYIRKPEIDYVYHLFGVELGSCPEVCLSHEHQGYHWASCEDLETMPLMAAAREAVECYRAFKKGEKG